MAAPASNAFALRQLLRERFPSSVRPAGAGLATGLAELDERTGGLPRSALTELTCTAPSCGSQLFIGQLLLAVRQQNARAALIDSADEFDPLSWPADALAHLVWVRCRTVDQAMSATDLLARDANLDFVALDLRHAAHATLRCIPSRTWYRLQRAVENTAQALLVLTPAPVVPSAQLRLQLDRPLALHDQDRERTAPISALAFSIQRQRLSSQLAG